LDRYQAVISRLANNQVQIKTWCVTALAALAALAVNNKEQGPLAIGLVVLCTFFFLDAYYLALERHFREESWRMVDEFLWDESPVDWADVLKIEGPRRGRAETWQAIRSCGLSLAVSPFYIALATMVVVGFIVAN
jgi:hypothetical protein